MSEALRIAQLSDCHLFADQHKAGYQNIKPYFSLRQVLRDLKKHRVDLVLVTGDISGDYTEASYSHFLNLWQEIGINAELRLLPGNHDCIETMLGIFPVGELWFEPLDYPKWQIQCLNTKGPATQGQLSAEQFLQLQQRVMTNGKHQFLAMHHHPIKADSWMDKHSWHNKQLFCDWVQRQKNVKAMVYGHIHTDKHHKLEHIDTWACPSTCWQWLRADEFAVSDELPGYRILELADNGQVQTQVYRVTHIE